jgi:hypothetical protein
VPLRDTTFQYAWPPERQFVLAFLFVYRSCFLA